MIIDRILLYHALCAQIAGTSSALEYEAQARHPQFEYRSYKRIFSAFRPYECPESAWGHASPVVASKYHILIADSYGSLRAAVVSELFFAFW